MKLICNDNIKIISIMYILIICSTHSVCFVELFKYSRPANTVELVSLSVVKYVQVESMRAET